MKGINLAIKHEIETIEELVELGTGIETNEKHYTHLEELQSERSFIEDVFELAFGDNAINRDYEKDEVLGELRGFSDQALKYDDLLEITKVLLIQVKDYSDNKYVMGNGYTYEISEIEKGLK